MGQWWQDQQLWRALGPFLFSPSIMGAADEDVEELLDELELPEGARVLDAGCGNGRLSLPLGRRGFKVVGVDANPYFCQAARRLVAQEDLPVEILSADLFAESLALDGGFDAILDVFALLGYHQQPAMDVLLARRFLELLVPGGQVLLQTRLPEAVYGTVKHVADGRSCIERRYFDPTNQTMVTAWTVGSLGGRQRAYRSAVRIYTRDDLVGLLEFAGFTDVRCWPDTASERLVTSGRRPA